MSEVKIALRQARAAMVSEFQLKQRLERIRWEEEVMKPELQRLAHESGENLEIPEFIVHED
jgi:hypothetical protein